jgi:hypothetical protein
MKHLTVLFLILFLTATAPCLLYNVNYNSAESPEVLISSINQTIEGNLKNTAPLCQIEALGRLDGVGIVCEIRQKSKFSEDAPIFGIEISRSSLVSQIRNSMKSVCATAGMKILEADEWKNSDTKSVLIMTVTLDPSFGQAERLAQKRFNEYREDADKWDVWVHLELMEQYILKRNQKYTLYGCTWSNLEAFKSKEERIDNLAIETSQKLLRQFITDCLAANSVVAAPQEQASSADK